MSFRRPFSYFRGKEKEAEWVAITERDRSHPGLRMTETLALRTSQRAGRGDSLEESGVNWPFYARTHTCWLHTFKK